MTVKDAESAVLEAAMLDIRPGEECAFENAIRVALPLISATPGFVSMEIRRCIETSSRYLLLVTWEKLEDHTIGFRQSDRYAEWKALLHHFYDPFPVVEHYARPLDLDL
ncbi:antibiotic biosynthesis monooxygenase [Methylosinus sp. Sm6]|uniref:antibiotic biosynthesis monooxygenase family protein n=1 Tax=Methylosinus sp. Sm6 TaxID=2866948 RepID=UPI001C991A2B|nr:antibiotic biosynthesis monooxygenase [Methylosinus sp. Sm6]MBY6241742.1 antibiotic biosynthesis monooxygenase [Methylosinus sp. Sm6]